MNRLSRAPVLAPALPDAKGCAGMSLDLSSQKLFVGADTTIGVRARHSDGRPYRQLALTLRQSGRPDRHLRTDRTGYASFVVHARSAGDTVRLSAKCAHTTLAPFLKLLPTLQPRTVPTFTRIGFHLRPTGNCNAFSVTPNRLRAGRPRVLTIRVRLARRPVLNAFVQVNGPGIHKHRTTGPSGVVRIPVSPRRAGTLTVNVPNLSACARRLPIIRPTPGKQLTG